MSFRPFRDFNRKKSIAIKVGNLDIGGDNPISVQSMTNTLTKLEKLGYIHVRPDWNDARKKRISISQSGIDARNYAIKSIKPILDEIVQVTDHLTKKSLLADLRSFRESIEKNRV